MLAPSTRLLPSKCPSAQLTWRSNQEDNYRATVALPLDCNFAIAEWLSWLCLLFIIFNCLGLSLSIIVYILIFLDLESFYQSVYCLLALWCANLKAIRHTATILSRYWQDVPPTHCHQEDLLIGSRLPVRRAAVAEGLLCPLRQARAYKGWPIDCQPVSQHLTNSIGYLASWLCKGQLPSMNRCEASIASLWAQEHTRASQTHRHAGGRLKSKNYSHLIDDQWDCQHIYCRRVFRWSDKLT